MVALKTPFLQVSNIAPEKVLKVAEVSVKKMKYTGQCIDLIEEAKEILKERKS